MDKFFKVVYWQQVVEKPVSFKQEVISTDGNTKSTMEGSVRSYRKVNTFGVFTYCNSSDGDHALPPGIYLLMSGDKNFLRDVCLMDDDRSEGLTFEDVNRHKLESPTDVIYEFMEEDKVDKFLFENYSEIQIEYELFNGDESEEEVS